MLNRNNIITIINEHKKTIDEIEKEISQINSPVVTDILKKKLEVLKDNKYRYELQAKAWGD